MKQGYAQNTTHITVCEEFVPIFSYKFITIFY